MGLSALPLLSRIKYRCGRGFGESLPISPCENTFFVWEPCSHSHGEVVPGYTKYLLDLGFKVSVLLAPERLTEGLFARFRHPRLEVHGFPQAAILGHFAKYGLQRSRGILITTARKIGDRHSYGSEYGLFPQRRADQRILLVEHDVRKAIDSGFIDANVLTLRAINYRNQLTQSVNPHYFGETQITHRADPDVVRFITVGALAARRRNVGLLVSAVERLHRDGLRNFKIAVIGKGSLEHLPAHLRPYFEIHGRVGFDALYVELEKSDFFLSLLDPDDPRHAFYRSTGTSGNFQLVYGFSKPCLVAEPFARPNRLTAENSVVYASNSDLVTAMSSAIRMDADDYAQRQLALRDLAETLYAESLATLRRVLGG